MNNSIVFFTFVVLHVLDSCRGSTWVRHRWVGITYQKNMDKVAKEFPNKLANSIPVELLEPQRRVNLCNNVLNFRLYTIGDEEDVHVQRVMAAIIHFYSAINKIVGFTLATTQNTDAGPITVYEIPCIDKRNFSLTVSYLPIMPSLKYVRISKTNYDNDDGFSSTPSVIKSELFALVENDAELNKRVTLDTKNMEALFLRNLYRETLFPDMSESDLVPYDFCALNVDDHFRLCSSVLNVIMDHIKYEFRDPTNTYSMPENRMYNICEHNKVKLRFQHHDFDNVSEVRARMVSCQLSKHQFYLVASVYDIGSAFFVHGHSAFDLKVEAYLRSIPVLQNYERDVQDLLG